MKPAQKKAIEIASRVMRSLRIRPGQTEKEIADWIIYEITSAGASLSFDIIVASGKRSLDPHAKPTGKKIKKGEQVVVDLGAKYQGYCSDITRTFFIGKPTGRYNHLYNTVLAAQKRAISVVKDGVWCRWVDLAARDIIKKHCFVDCHISEKKCPGECFIHTTGHGVGRKVHEAPRISLKSRQKLKAGMVITVEPGIYVKGWGGLRIEDMVLVTKTGCKVLT
ncbi:MAG: M24 family metallopeptidase [Candidatus Margulisbacteria bacterium]|nr:M24 family metallopeptidase [Candidatus Margulisiibacteriota bacterium]